MERPGHISFLHVKVLNSEAIIPNTEFCSFSCSLWMHDRCCQELFPTTVSSKQLFTCIPVEQALNQARFIVAKPLLFDFIIVFLKFPQVDWREICRNFFSEWLGLPFHFRCPFLMSVYKFLFTYQILLYLHLHLRWLTAPSSLYLVVHVWKHFGIWLSLTEWSTVAVACDNIKRSHLCCLGIVFECVDVLLLLSDSPTLSLSLRVRHCYQIVPPIHFHCGFNIVPINLSFDKQMTLDWLSLIP